MSTRPAPEFRDSATPPSAARVERRSSGAGHDALRRCLREADRQLYLSRVAQLSAPLERRRGATTDVLRRLLRNADRRNFELAHVAVPPRRAHATPWPRYRAVAVAAMLLVAAGAVAERQPLRRAVVFVTDALDLSPRAVQAVDAPTSVLPPLATPVTPIAPRTSEAGEPKRPHLLPPSSAVASRMAHAALPLIAEGTTGIVAASDEAGVVDTAPASLEPTGRLVLDVDLSHQPVFSPAFEADRSALVENETPAPGVVGAANGGFVRVLSIANDRGRNYHPRLSPDGRMIAFDSDRDGTRGVYVASSEGRHVRRISGTDYAAFPAWSPDGQRLAFIKSEPGDPTVWNVWSTDVRTGATARLTSFREGQPWGVTWFPDGRRICYAHEHEIDVLDIVNGETHTYNSPRADRPVRMPVVSPDGARVLFQIHNDGAWLLELADGSMREVLADPAANDFAWSPDGHRIVFRLRGGEWTSWSLEPGS